MHSTLPLALKVAAIERQLQVANVATDLVVLGIAGGLPKRNSDAILIGDKGGYPVGTLA